MASVLGSSMAFIDSSVVNVALPKMEAELSATLVAMTWVINSYTLCMSALLLIGGAAADQLGRRRMFIIGTTIFAIASIGCGIAPTVDTLIVARAVQGVGAALLIPCSLAIIGAAFDPKERGAAIGIWSGASAMAAGGGPLFGGWLVDDISWRAIFLINPFLAVPTILIAVRYLEESRDSTAKRGLDWLGALLAFAGLGALIYGLIAAADQGWGSPRVVGTLLAAPILLAAFIWAEGRARVPMMPLEVFRSATFSGVNVLTLLLYGALGGAIFFLPFLLIQVHGYSATEAGAVFLPFTLVLAVLSKWGGSLADRFGARLPQIIGPAVVAAGLFMLSIPGTDGTYWRSFLLPMVILGLGMAITVAPLTTTVLNSVAGDQTGVASGINNAVARVAGLLLIAILGTVGLTMLNHSLNEHLAQVQAAPEVRATVDKARKGFDMPEMPREMSDTSRAAAHKVIAESFVETIRRILLLTCALCIAGSAVAAFTIRNAARAACLVLLSVMFVTPARSQTLALTFDDGPDMSDEVYLNALERNEAILKQLDEAHLKSILFVTRTDADPTRNELIRQWGIRGHQLGNHTATHPDFDEVTLVRYEQEVLSCEQAIQAMPGFTRRFRFPYLKEGDTVQKRDGFRAFLDAHGYKVGAVSIDASDWYYSQRLRERLKQNPGADIRPYRDAYLRHIHDRAVFYDSLSHQVLDRSVAHVLLLHHNLINALFLADLIQMFKADGWTLVDSETAFTDAVYAMRPGTLPAGESILWSLAKEKGVPGLRYPAEDDIYEKPILDRLHL